MTSFPTTVTSFTDISLTGQNPPSPPLPIETVFKSSSIQNLDEKISSLSKEAPRNLFGRVSSSLPQPSSLGVRSRDDLEKTDSEVRKKSKTTQGVITNFKDFIETCEESSYNAPQQSRKAPLAPQKIHPQMATPELRMKKLEQRLKEDSPTLLFLKAAFNPKPQFGQLVGSGDYVNVYKTGDGTRVIKIAKDYIADDKAAFLQGTEELYKLAEASLTQYEAIREAFEKKIYPFDVLEITNKSTCLVDGHFEQPFVTKMFKPTWDVFVAKIAANGKSSQITDVEEALLQSIQQAFQETVEKQIWVDLKPDNLGYIPNEAGGETVVIIDTFGLRKLDEKEMIARSKTNIKTFAQGSSHIEKYLSQVLV